MIWTFQPIVVCSGSVRIEPRRSHAYFSQRRSGVQTREASSPSAALLCSITFEVISIVEVSRCGSRGLRELNPAHLEVAGASLQMTTKQLMQTKSAQKPTSAATSAAASSYLISQQQSPRESLAIFHRAPISR